MRMTCFPQKRARVTGRRGSAETVLTSAAPLPDPDDPRRDRAGLVAQPEQRVIAQPIPSRGQRSEPAPFLTALEGEPSGLEVGLDEDAARGRRRRRHLEYIPHFFVAIGDLTVRHLRLSGEVSLRAFFNKWAAV